MKDKRKIVVIGGGLAGLVSAYLLAKNGQQVLLVEKKHFPFHRVCGEYLSNEVLVFLKKEGLLPIHQDFPQISRFLFSDTSGKEVKVPLSLGGFGISRYVLDEYIYREVLKVGGEVKTGIQVESVSFNGQERQFTVRLVGGEEFIGDYVIGAFGKRSKLDKVLKRAFIDKRSPYIGVKYHIKSDFIRDTVGLYNFKGGYCGINAIEDGKSNLCYLGNRDHLREYGSIPAMEREILWKNAGLKRLFSDSEFLFEKPEVINEINFEPKAPIENHILMAGDSAGLITPLCGNGMAMAIHSGKLAAEAILYGKSRNEVEDKYRKDWNLNFRRRLWVGRKVQLLFGTRQASDFTRNLIQHIPFFASLIIKNTHGRPF
ncbi:NAD(P)/FAD-dependent oxidoreductase [Algoriphagus sp. AGSA1]|uniref:NAD(P)/FAD-dependent oxidoreductase n=1 Tax=Algoriphagus sp. AGSA1 TaxID=2907213 RepID=UPI001F3FD775|nr:NAD(P)/FAD-dependent oxidoreductase [Algoriphagus sp. AGSA1]